MAQGHDVTVGRSRVPPLGQGVVDRPVLLDTLAAAHAPVVLVSAPAGYGKTTLLAMWAQRDERRFAWVALERTHDDPVVLSAALLDAMASVAPVDPGVQVLVDAPGQVCETHVVPAVARAWERARGQVVLVLDDVHVLTQKRCLGIVADLAERVPVQGRLALATRRDPALPLGSLRAHGRLTEIRAGDLALGTGEAKALFEGAGLALGAAAVDRLVRRTEGWATGLYLAAVSLRDREDPERFVEHFAGTTRHVADFLSEDVLARQPRTVTRFLHHTCVVEELTGSLCRALTEDPNAELTLRELERSNLFVVPLDDERRAYRYHPLFAEYLRADVARHRPHLLPVVHRRAWRWYRRHGLVTHAVLHAQAAGDVEVAAELVADHWPALLDQGRAETLRALLAGFTGTQIRGHASLAAAELCLAALTGERVPSPERVVPDDAADPPVTSPCRELAARAGAVSLDGVSSIRAAAQRAVDLGADAAWRPLCLAVLGVANKLEGDFPNARRCLLEVVRLTDRATAIGILALGYLALISLREGDDEQALAYARAAHPAVERPGMRELGPAVVIFTVEANVLTRRGEPAAAAEAMERAEALLTSFPDTLWWQLVDARIWLAQALAAQGRGKDAGRLIAQAQALLGRYPDAGKLKDWTTEAALALATGIPGSPAARLSCEQLTRAERRILGLLAGELTLREIGRELCLSRNTIKTHTHSIYRKLGVSCRAEAVAMSRAHPVPVMTKGAQGEPSRTGA